MANSKKGMGWDKAAKDIMQKQDISRERADKILGAGARKASPKAIAANPNLKKVPGVVKKSGRGA